MHLNPVYAGFNLLVYLSNNFSRCMHDQCVPARALIGEQAGGGAANAVDQDIAACCHAGPFDHDTFDGVTQIDTDIKYAVRIKEAGKADAQYLLGIDPGNQGSQSITTMEEQLLSLIHISEPTRPY